jgi:RHS repeat-associated protein
MAGSPRQEEGAAGGQSQSHLLQPPSISLPKGGGAIRGIGEKFTANPVTGTGSMSVPIAISPGRGGFGPQLSLSYDSGAGNGAFGLGWNLALPSIKRKTDKGLPQYLDEQESDVFLLAGAEDLVPIPGADGLPLTQTLRVHGVQYRVRSYRPRIEGLFARIERWVQVDQSANMFWRTISRDNVTTWYGRDADSRLYDPAAPERIFEWVICLTHDDKGNAATYHYKREDAANVVKTSVEEANRSDTQRTANLYLDRIRYGNAKPYLPTLAESGAVWAGPNDLPGQSWMFEVVFDYSASGSAGSLTAAPANTANWFVRPDAFSTHRAGFEVRTYRLCRRVLMFHHFKGEPGVGTNCLVRSTEFDYAIPSTIDDENKPGYTTLRSVTHRSYQRVPGSNTAYESRALPPVSFRYSEPKVDLTVHTIDPGQLANLPVGTQGPGYRWLDLNGEGLSGVLSEDRGAWYYKSNLGDGRFGPTRVVAQVPAMAVAAGSGHQFIDLAGDGSIDVVEFAGPTPGFHERDGADGWNRYTPFALLPNINWQDPNLRFVDLTGDGHADALITEGDLFTWYPSLDERGFDAARRQHQPIDDESGPRLVFADGTETIFLADMCGDGLTDLVRIRNGDVCYWPNLGYGRFGRKVRLGNAPRFETPDLFDPGRIRLSDIDGSGTVDIIYLGRDGARLYFNRSGNSLSNPLTVALPVATHNLAAVQVADLLGNGTACLVWNSHLPAHAGQQVRYIDLMAGQRANAEVDNNLGATTTIEYTPSTRFYLQDQQAGTPWVTRLPFPVHCVSKVTVKDAWRKTTFSSTYSYHHGHFDGYEREFRGFGRVEQVDTQAFKEAAVANATSGFFTQDDTLYQAPVKTITWYHTGLAEDRNNILGLFEKEYLPARYKAAFTTAGFDEPRLPQPVIDAGADPALTGDEWREAMRACKGMPLRQEVVELDAKTLEESGEHKVVRIFSATQHNCHLRRLQPRGTNRHAVFLALESESYTCHYELDLTQTTLSIDPRIAHTLNLKFDEWGNTLQSVAVVYPRRAQFSDRRLSPQQVDVIRSVQAERHIAYTEARFTEELEAKWRNRHHRLPLPCEVRTYELSGDDPVAGFAPKAGSYFTVSDFREFALSDRPSDQVGKPVADLAYHKQPTSAIAHKRLVEHGRTLFWSDGSDTAPPSIPLDFGKHGPRGLKYEDYKLALTDELLAAVYADKLTWVAVPAANPQPAKTCRDLLNDPKTSGYVRGNRPELDGTSKQYWMRSGTAGFEPDAYDHFFLPECYTDAFGNTTTLQYDPRDLYVQSSRDALGNRVEVVQFDYRVMAPKRLSDANNNISEVAFDIRGLPVASAVLGKVTRSSNNTETTETGNTLATLSFANLNPTPQEVSAFFNAANFNETQARTWLGKATARFVYYFGEDGNPAGACSVLRERHERDLANIEANRIPVQVAFEYSDGAGQAFVKKVRAEAESPGGPLRCITNGKTFVNNKGKPVLQFEPYFSPSGHRFAEPQAVGVSPVMFYDAAGRLVRTEMPDGTFSRVEFSPWYSRSFDANDTVLQSRWYRERLTITERTPQGGPRATATAAEEQAASRALPQEKRAARLAARHDGTPAETHFDSLGREVVAIAHNRTPDATGKWIDEFNLTFTKLDAEGKPLWIRDARGNLVMQYITPPKPTRLVEDPSEAPSYTDAISGQLVRCAPCYDIAGNLLHQHSMDAGDRWMLMDAAGKPMLAWDLNDKGPGTPMQRRLYRTDYDALHRPVAQRLKLDDAEPALIESFAYEDTRQYTNADFIVTAPAGLEAAQRGNLLGQAVQHRDPSGLAGVKRIDISGQPAHITRRLIRADPPGADGLVDWSVGDTLLEPESETFHQITDFDALGRMTRQFNWHRDLTYGANGSATFTDGSTNRVAVYVPAYNARGLLESEWLYVRASKDTVNGLLGFRPNPVEARSAQAIQGITYNAKGQKLTLDLGNGTQTRYSYDDKTFRLTHLFTTRLPDDAFPDDCDSRTANNARPLRPCGVQNLHYTYDPVGNITNIQDDAQQTVFFRNSMVEPSSDYTYDALYRLIEAKGREHAVVKPPPLREAGWTPGSIPTDDQLQNYTQRYVYDVVGNFVEMAHKVDNGRGVDWTRHYTTQVDSNRLHKTWISDNTLEAVTYRHDAHGSMLNFNRLDIDVRPQDPPIPEDERWGRQIQWDWRDMIHRFDAIGGGLAQYHYGIDKQRTRKHITRLGGGVVEDRIYLGGYELYRRRNSANGAVVEEIESLHLFEGEQRVLLVDDVITAEAGRLDGPTVREQTLFRYQYGNHLGSVGLELDVTARVISYEEFHPYGTSAYRLMNSDAKAPLKRYRYTGMERDEETGLNYHKARYLAASLGRWVSVDQLLDNSLTSSYSAMNMSPIMHSDRDGAWAELGHFYTVLLAGLAAGFSLDKSFRLAFYAQLPDEVATTDAVANGISSTLENIGNAKGKGDAIQEGLHALTGQDSKKETEFRRGIVMRSTFDFETGAALHAFGDSYSHRVMGDESKMYKHLGTGHGVVAGTAPDQVELRPQLYKAYANDLYSLMLQLKSDNSSYSSSRENSAPRLSAEQFKKIIEAVAAKPTEATQISELLAQLEKSMPDVSQEIKSREGPGLGEYLWRPEKAEFSPNVISKLFANTDSKFGLDELLKSMTSRQKAIVGIDTRTDIPSALLNLAKEWKSEGKRFHEGAK